MKNKGGNVNLAENIYEASATFGQIVSYFQLFAGLIIGALVIVLGVYLLRSKPLDGKGKAVVTAINCNEADKTNNNCTSTVQFTGSDGKQYSANIQGIYSIGQEIPINYDPKHPETANKSLSNRNIGITCIVVGSLILLASSIWFYLVQRYKMAAAVNGVGQATNIITNTV